MPLQVRGYLIVVSAFTLTWAVLALTTSSGSSTNRQSIGKQQQTLIQREQRDRALLHNEPYTWNRQIRLGRSFARTCEAYALLCESNSRQYHWPPPELNELCRLLGELDAPGLSPNQQSQYRSLDNRVQALLRNP